MKTFFNLTMLLFLSSELPGQLCSGSLGDPVMQVSFGSGDNPGESLSPVVTNYTYLSEPCPSTGGYTLINSSFVCQSQGWHVIPADHTANEAKGYMMLVNASSNPGDVYLGSVNGLCPNTSYEFAVWAMNVSQFSSCEGDAIDPNLTLRIETTAGNVLALYNSNDIVKTQNPTWRQLGLFFRTPVGTSSVIFRIISNRAGGCGNDFALDDITISPCGPNVSTHIAANNDVYVDACLNSNTTFLLSSKISGGYQNPSVQWQTSLNNGISWNDISGANSFNYTTLPASTPGSVQYRMLIAEAENFSSASCRIATNSVTVNITALPFVQATNYVFGCFGSDVALFASGGSTFKWTGPNGFSSNAQHPIIPKVKYTDAGIYRVVVSTSGGCANVDSTNLEVYPAAKAFVGSNVTICEGKSTTLNASGGVRYRWSPGKGLSNDTIPNPIATPSETTRYAVTVFSEFGCSDTGSVLITVREKPQVDAGADKKTRLGLGVKLNGSVNGDDISISWSPTVNMQNPNILQPFVNPSVDTRYTIQATSNFGCGTSTDDVFVKVYDKVVVPNAFSPNGDGINDRWIIEPLDLFEESVTIVFNRYGQIVFKSNGYSQPWDGTRNGQPIPVGVYYYSIELKNEKKSKLTGWVTILR